MKYNKKQEKHCCDITCIYFPTEDYINPIYEIDKNKVKRMIKKEHKCRFDNHIITKWEDCSNYILYKSFKNKTTKETQT